VVQSAKRKERRMFVAAFLRRHRRHPSEARGWLRHLGELVFCLPSATSMDSGDAEINRHAAATTRVEN